MNKRTITNLIADCFSNRQTVDLEAGFGQDDRYWLTEEFAYHDECMDAATRITQRWPWVAVEIVGSRDYRDCVMYIYPRTMTGPNSSHEYQGYWKPGQIITRHARGMFCGIV